MAEVTRTLQLLVCDKCAQQEKETRAIAQATVTIGERSRSLDLCGMHLRALNDVWMDTPLRPKGTSSRVNPERLDNPVECPICDEDFPNRYSLGQHTRSTHGQWADRIAELNRTLRDSQKMSSDRRRRAEDELNLLLAEARDTWRAQRAVMSRAEDQERVDA